MEGTIKRWSDFRGFGLIDVVDQEKDIFVHVNDIKGLTSPKVGDTVEFNVIISYKGPQAVNVKLRPS